MDPLLALDCPKCGAALGAALPSGEHLCAHCGERSRPKVEVVHVAVPQKPTYNVVPTATEVAARNAEFARNSARDQASRDERAQRAATTRAEGRTVIIVFVVMGVLVVGALVGGVFAFLIRH